MNLFRLSTKDVSIHVSARDRQEAFAKFFRKIKLGELPIDQIGGLVISHESDDDYPFRTTPSVWRMGLITKEQAVAHVREMLGTEEAETIEILEKAAEADSWIVKKIKDLERLGAL